MKYITVVRGKLKASDPKQSQAAHDATVRKVSVVGKSMGTIGHQAYLSIQDPRLFLAVDAWNNLEGLQKLYSDPNLAAEFATLFEGQPEVAIYAEAEGWEAY